MTLGEPRRLIGLDYLEAITSLLQRTRAAHPTAGLYEAADLQWWWRAGRTTDSTPQLVWFDPDDRPEAAASLTDWGEQVALNPMVLPDAPPPQVAEVVERGLDHARSAGFDAIGVEADRADDGLRRLLTDHGLVEGDDAFVEAWMAVEARPAPSPLADGYRLRRRSETLDRPSHLIRRNQTDVAARLAQTSLYRPDLDLLIVDPSDTVAAYGLFWFDPTTATGLVEPMRTEEDHQRRGLARHVLTAGLDALAGAGAERIKICFGHDNPPARDLYLSVGFEPTRETVEFSGRLAGD
ncbi:MAG: GNAT family N-acetyltransferase [Actinomycetota bacterium]